VRVLAAGNQDLDAAVAAGRLRADLFYRLNEFTLRIPPLRERKEDLLYLAKRFLDLTNQELEQGGGRLFRVRPSGRCSITRGRGMSGNCARPSGGRCCWPARW
jgi:hypothetical protein